MYHCGRRKMEWSWNRLQLKPAFQPAPSSHRKGAVPREQEGNAPALEAFGKCRLIPYISLNMKNKKPIKQKNTSGPRRSEQPRADALPTREQLLEALAQDA